MESDQWCRLPKPGEKLEGVGKSFIISLIKAGVVESRLIGIGKRQKIRVVDRHSLRRWIDQQINLEPGRRDMSFPITEQNDLRRGETLAQLVARPAPSDYAPDGIAP